MFTRFRQVDGYTFQEVLLCFAVVLMAFSIAECFARGFDTFASMIGNGEFDRIMVRPRNEILQVLSSRIELSRVGRFAQAVIIFVYAIPESGVVWTGDKILTLILMILSGTVIFSCLFVVYACGICSAPKRRADPLSGRQSNRQGIYAAASRRNAVCHPLPVVLAFWCEAL